MSKKINSKRELPKSFDLNKYDSLEYMSDKDLFRQLYWRSEDLDITHTDYPDYGLEVGSDYPLQNNLGDPFGEINESEEFLERQKEREYRVKPNLLCMSYGEGIKPLTRFDVSLINKMNSECGYWKEKPIIVDDEMVGDLFTEDNGMFWAVMREPVNLLNDTLENALISIDLNNRDDVLIDTFTNLLPLWRKEMKFPEPEKPISGGWESVRRKIIDYKIIPLIDLLSWSHATKSKISLGVLAVALFPDGDKDTFMIAQTVKPYLDKLMKINSLEKLKKELSK
ncbi:DUF6387 family protein [Serratia nevei]|uniref:DUF6387 family protein n=1 Tax=Serratia nevei TaxID=2703794 RepID=UPI003F6C2019